MKKLALLILFIGTTLIGFGQIKKPDTTITTYIRTRNLVKITDSAALPKIVVPYYHKLIDFVKTNLGYQLKSTYVLTAYIHDTAKELSIPINDMSGILAHKKAEEPLGKIRDTIINGKRIRIETPMFNGDPGGRKVNVIFNKITGQVKYSRSN